MKLISKILLFIFITFLLSPSVISMIDRNQDASAFFNITEEELAKEHGKNYIFIDFNHEILFLSDITSKIIFSENHSKHETISAKIFIPPPDRV